MNCAAKMDFFLVLAHCAPLDFLKSLTDASLEISDKVNELRVLEIIGQNI